MVIFFDAANMLTLGGGVDNLISGSIPSDSPYFFQIINVGNGRSLTGRKIIEVTLSDGVTCVNCFVAPQVFHVFDDGTCTKYDVVKVHNFVCNAVDDGYKIVVLQMSHHFRQQDVIGDPNHFKKKQKQSLKATAPGRQNVKRKPLLLTEDNYKQESAVVAESQSNIFTRCENCNELPCEWTEFGPTILQHIENEYMGRYVDEKGNVVDEDDAYDIIGNKQLWFIAYSAYTDMKHGYLGKQKRIKIPYCIECGIRANYPDENNVYVGFKEASV